VNFYSQEEIEQALENGDLESEDAGFMLGYLSEY
jgi:hypothetical protein|tara:strand:+ start:3608 stop:3709 length:102 start_codon:yes stop_codon:yes gene_type:complete